MVFDEIARLGPATAPHGSWPIAARPSSTARPPRTGTASTGWRASRQYDRIPPTTCRFPPLPNPPPQGGGAGFLPPLVGEGRGEGRAMPREPSRGDWSRSQPADERDPRPMKLPLRVALTTTLVALIVLTVAAIGYVGHRNARFTAEDLCSQILDKNSEIVESQVNSLLDVASRQGNLNLDLLRERQMDTRTFNQLGRFWISVLKTHPRLSRQSIALEATGEWSFVRRVPGGKLAIGELRLDPPDRPEGASRLLAGGLSRTSPSAPGRTRRSGTPGRCPGTSRRPGPAGRSGRGSIS